MVRRVLVLDKSYLEAQPARVIKQLCGDFSVLMIDSLFMEIMTTRDKKRQANCFKKFPPIDNPVVLISGVSSLLQYESEHQAPVTPIIDRRIPIRFAFNPEMACGTYRFLDEHLSEMRRFDEEVAEDVDHLTQNAAVLADLFPSLSGYKPGQSSGEIERIRHIIASDSACVRDFYSSIRAVIPGTTFPPADLITRDWAFFRWVQVKLLASVEFIRRYGFSCGEISSSKIPHDVVDSQYLICATLANGLATGDGTLIREFVLLCPEGLLLR